MQSFNVKDLIPHPQNEFFFDEMTGQKWEEFLESVRTSGVIEPPVVTDKRVIVSGHQRIRACKELGIEALNCEVRIYDNEDKVTKDLIETNIRQRGTIGGSDMKTGRIIKELERIYGVRVGSAGNPDPQVADGKTQAELAQELKMSQDKLNRLKKLPELPKEFQEMLETGKISTNTAATLISKLSEDEQNLLLKELPAAQKFTQAQIQTKVDEIKMQSEAKEQNLRNALTVKNRMIEDAQAEADKYKERVDLLESTPIKIPDEKIRKQIDLLKQKEREQYEVAQTAIRDKAKLEEEKRKMEQQHAKDMSDLERRLNKAVEGDGDDVNALKERIKELEKQAEVREQNERQTLTILGRNRTHTELVQEAQGRLLGELSNHNLDYYIREQRENNLIADMSQAFKDLICEHGEAMIHEIVVVLKYCGWEEDIEWKIKEAV